ncbi:hypothetical protein D3C72_2197240 [compost metagenome]
MAKTCGSLLPSSRKALAKCSRYSLLGPLGPFDRAIWRAMSSSGAAPRKAAFSSLAMYTRPSTLPPSSKVMSVTRRK